MTILNVNLLAILVCTVVHMVLGFLWYGPIFGKMWLQAIGKTPEQLSGATQAYVVSGASSLVMAIAVGMLISAAQAQNVVAGITLAAVAGIGFIATTQMTTSAYESRNQTVTLLGIGYQVVGAIIMGAIQGAWR